jgi:hypothetical protein
VLLTVVTIVETITDCELWDAVTILNVTGGVTSVLDSELLNGAVTITVMVELEIIVTDVISLNGRAVTTAVAVEEEDEEEDEIEFELAAELAWFGATVEIPPLTVAAIELELVVVELTVLRLLELDGLAVLVVKLLRKCIVLLARNTPVVYVYDTLTLTFDWHDAGMEKQHGSPLVVVVDETKTPE